MTDTIRTSPQPISASPHTPLIGLAYCGDAADRDLTSHQAGLYGIPDRGRIEEGAFADLLLFDADAVGVSPARRVNDLPGRGRRTIRDPVGVHGVFVNGVEVFDGRDYRRLGKGPGQVLDRFLPTGPAPGSGAR